MTNTPTSPNSNVLNAAAAVAEGIPKSARPLVALIRAKMRDFPELNRLVAGQETSDGELFYALMETLEDYNMSPPLIATVTLLAHPSPSLLINGAIVRVLESLAILQNRNHMVYSDGQGVQVSVSDKAPQLMQFQNLFQSRYERQRDKLKLALNLNGALNRSGVPSEYALVNGYYDTLDLGE